MCWFDTMLSSPCARYQRKLKVNTHETNIYRCDLKWYTDKTHGKDTMCSTCAQHVLNTEVNFVLENNIWAQVKHAVTLPGTLRERQFAG